MNAPVTEEKGLIVPEKINAVTIFSEGKVDPLIEEITKKAKELVPDTSTGKGRDAIKSMAYKVTRSKTYLDDLGKQLVADKKAEIKKVEASRKIIRDKLDALRDKVKKPLTDWEVAEEKRKAEEALKAEINQAWDEAIEENKLFDRRLELKKKEAELHRKAEIRGRIDKIRGYMNITNIKTGQPLPLDELVVLLSALKQFDIDSSFDEFQKEASEAKTTAVSFLQICVDNAKKTEEDRIKKEAAEAARRKEEEEKSRLQKAKLQAEIDAQKAEKKRKEETANSRQNLLKQIDAKVDYQELFEMGESAWSTFYNRELKAYQEQKEREAAEKAERDRIAAAEQAEKDKQAAIEAERQRSEEEAQRKESERLEAERLVKEEANRKAADQKHRNQVESEAQRSLIKALKENVETDLPLDVIAEIVVLSISKGEIKHVSIKY